MHKSLHAPLVLQWIRDAKDILRETEQTVQDLSKAIGRNYHQVYRWIVFECEPQGESTIRLIKWVLSYRPELVLRLAPKGYFKPNGNAVSTAVGTRRNRRKPSAGSK